MDTCSLPNCSNRERVMTKFLQIAAHLQKDVDTLPGEQATIEKKYQ